MDILMRKDFSIVAVMVLAGLVALPNAFAGGGSSFPSCAVGTAMNPSYTELAGVTAAEATTYHTMIDHTQAEHPFVIVSNTETKAGKGYPLTGAKPNNPWSAIDGDVDMTGASSDQRVHYREVMVNNADNLNATLTDATAATKGTNTYIHRLGSYNGGSGGSNGCTTVTTAGTSITPLKLTASPVTCEKMLDVFSVNGQAFDLDRLRYVANKLWKKWKMDVQANDGWYAKFGYQPTGTMSFEQFISNVNNQRPMFGIVRVVWPVEMSKGKGNIKYDSTFPVDGNEFTGTPTWTNGGPSKLNEMNNYYSVSKTCAKVIEVYGTLIYDYVSVASYRPWDFETTQDYTDNSTTGTYNVLLPRSSSKNVYMKVYESIYVNPVNDKVMGDHTTAGRDYRMDSIAQARDYMSAAKGATGVKTDMAVGKVSDSYIWEYWMRVAAKAIDATTRSGILTKIIAQYNPITETFAAGSSLKTDFATAWASMPTKDQFHAFWPNGYERGWMIAFDALDLDGTEWTGLPDAADSSIDGKTVSVAFPTKTGGVTKYPLFKVPTETIDEDYYNGVIPFNGAGVVVDADPASNPIPNMFLKSWEDLPALTFAGGVLDMHAHANISGMLYTPDSGEIEAKSDKKDAFQYMNGAVLIGNGVFFEDGGSGHSAIAVVFNDNTFDQLRSAAAVTITKPKSIREISGQ